MGSENSTQSSQRVAVHQRAVKSSSHVARSLSQGARNKSDSLDNSDLGRPRSISPGPSVCSDNDLPYISYTVNRPIGDSPKLSNKHTAKSKGLKKASAKSFKKSTHNIIVVKPAVLKPNVDKDPDIVKLQNIPMFLPIMRGTLHLPAVRDPEVLERLDPSPFYHLCVKYQTYLNSCATLVAGEQNVITQKVKEGDCDISKIVYSMVENQKRFSKYAEKLLKVQELSHQLNKCHMLLNQTLESMETLNNCLDIEDRLEPFVWTTG